MKQSIYSKDLPIKKNRLLIVEILIRRSPDRRIMVRCECRCGNKNVIARFKDIKENKIKSCGCLRKEGKKIHGKSRTRTYRIWKCMISRCYNKNRKYYPRYGGRGIKVCKQWHNYENFLADMGECPIGYSIERKNNNRGYKLSNCIWIPLAIQAENRSNTIRIRCGDRVHSLKSWCRELKLEYHTVLNQYRRGITIQRIFSKKSDKNQKLIFEVI